MVLLFSCCGIIIIRGLFPSVKSTLNNEIIPSSSPSYLSPVACFWKDLNAFFTPEMHFKLLILKTTERRTTKDLSLAKSLSFSPGFSLRTSSQYRFLSFFVPCTGCAGKNHVSLANCDASGVKELNFQRDHSYLYNKANN